MSLRLFLSCLYSNHWILVVIVSRWSKVFYFDSLILRGSDGKNARNFLDIKGVLDDAYRYVLNSTHATFFQKNASGPLVHDFTFPCMQQTVERCGFYVMCHMDEFVRHYNNLKSEEELKNNMTLLSESRYDYNKDHSRVRELWAHFVNDEVVRPGGAFYYDPLPVHNLPKAPSTSTKSKEPQAKSKGQSSSSKTKDQPEARSKGQSTSSQAKDQPKAKSKGQSTTSSKSKNDQPEAKSKGQSTSSKTKDDQPRAKP